MAIYNISWMNNVTSPLDIFTGTSQTLSSSYPEFMVGYLLLIAFFCVFLGTMYNKYDLGSVLIVDFFFLTLLSVIFLMVGLVPTIMVTISSILFIIVLILYMIFQK